MNDELDEFDQEVDYWRTQTPAHAGPYRDLHVARLNAAAGGLRDQIVRGTLDVDRAVDVVRAAFGQGSSGDRYPLGYPRANGRVSLPDQAFKTR